MRILVIGATGTIGKAVVSLLQDDNEILSAGSSGGDYQVDLSDKSSIRALYESAGPIDAVICTAGVAGFGEFLSFSDDDFELALRNKLMGQVNLIRIGVEFVKAGGTIVLTSGVLAQEPMPGSAVIAMANGGLESLVRAAALEITDITINVVSPIFVRETMAKMGMDTDGGLSAADTALAYKAAIEQGHHGETLDVRKFA